MGKEEKENDADTLKTLIHKEEDNDNCKNLQSRTCCSHERRKSVLARAQIKVCLKRENV